MEITTLLTNKTPKSVQNKYIFNTFTDIKILNQNWHKELKLLLFSCNVLCFICFCWAYLWGFWGWSWFQNRPSRLHWWWRTQWEVPWFLPQLRAYQQTLLHYPSLFYQMLGCQNRSSRISGCFSIHLILNKIILIKKLTS